MGRNLFAWGLIAAGLIAGWTVFLPPTPGADPAAGAEDEQVLKQAKQESDNEALLEYFRKRTLGKDEREKIAKLIQELGDESFAVREKASGELVSRGTLAVSALQKALKDNIPETVRRAEQCLSEISKGANRNLAAAVARLLAIRKPAKTAEVLLDYLPSADDESVADEVRAALAAVAVREGKPDPHVLQALTDKVPIRRASAAFALCAAKATDQRPALLKLLKDPDVEVRLRVGMGLASLGQKEAIPVLIDLLGTESYEHIWQVEDLLVRIAGDKAPTVDSGDNEASRKKFRDAWLTWWEKNGDKADLAKLEGTRPLLGYTLVILLDAGRIIDLDANNKPRFTLDNLEFPLDAQMLPGDRVLVAEHNANRVTERNRKGEIVWKKEGVAEPIMAQRLANGHTFIGGRSELVEVDKEGKQVWTHTRSDGVLFMKIAKCKNGDIACISSDGKFLRFDTSGKELQSFPVELQTYGGRLEMLPNNNVLIPIMQLNKVIEYNSKGAQVWTVDINQPIAAVRLPNGHTLITTYDQKRAIEVDRAGKQVWEYKSNTRVTRAFRR